jgi:nucleotide-binding universal stress UspA family protein
MRAAGYPGRRLRPFLLLIVFIAAGGMLLTPQTAAAQTDAAQSGAGEAAEEPAGQDGQSGQDEQNRPNVQDGQESAQRTGASEAGGEAAAEANEAGAERKVYLYPLRVRETGPAGRTLRRLSDSINDTLELTLRLMDGYQAEILPRGGPTEPEGLRRAADELGADAIVFGSLRREGRGVQARVRVYERSADEVSPPVEMSADSLLETVDLADRIIAELLERYSGMRVSFGSLVLEPQGMTDPYRVRIDGVEAGENLRRMDKLLTGSHTVSIVQKRGSGERVLLERQVQIREGEETSISFTLPYLTQDERAFFLQQDRTVVGGWPFKDEDEVPEAFSRALERSSAGERAGIEALADLHTKYLGWRRAYSYYLEEESGDGGPLVPQKLSAGQPFPYAGLSPELLPAQTKEEYREVAAGAELLAGAFDAADTMYTWGPENRLPRLAIILDGSLGDWQGRALIRQDPGSAQGRAGDISAVYLAQRDDRLYGGLQFHRRAPDDRGHYRLTIHGRYGTLELRFRRTGSGGSGEWRASAVCRGAGDAPESGNLPVASGAEGLEFAIPLEKAAACTAAGPISVEAGAVSGSTDGTAAAAGPQRAYLASSRRYDQSLWPGMQRGRSWRASMRFGSFFDGWSKPTFLGTVGFYYRLAGSLHVGSDLYFLPERDYGGPPMFPAPAFLLRSEREKPAHLFSVLPLPGTVSNEPGSFFLLSGYGFSYRGFIVHALTVTDLARPIKDFIGLFMSVGILF